MRTNTESDFKLKYGSVDPEINAQTFVGSILGFSALVQEVNREFNTGKNIDIRIKALVPGSFIVHFDVVETVIETVKHLFTEPHIRAAGEIVGTATGLLTLRKLLKKESPKVLEQSGQNITIENSDGASITFDQRTVNLYVNNPTIAAAINRTLEPLQDDVLVTGFTITDIEDKPLFAVDRQDLPDMIVGKVLPTPEKTQSPTQKTTLGIVKPSFDRKLKWEILFFGTKQFAEVTDENFLDKVAAGERFGCGDSLEVDLQLVQNWDESVSSYLTKEYKITKVYSHIPAAEQKALPLNAVSAPSIKYISEDSVQRVKSVENLKTKMIEHNTETVIQDQAK